ncbi:MAG: hypothetical protein MJE77_28560 [Proteobacteria bacterium]|nr:hypothetical protein [Pseudomonadota bacterium]
MKAPEQGSDEVLLTRLRDLSLVDLDALLAGTAGTQYAELLTSYADDLCDALRTARERARDLIETAVRGPDPMGLLDAPYQTRARNGGREAAQRVAERLAARASACRSLARIDDLASQLYPRLVEADRRLASLGTQSQRVP